MDAKRLGYTNDRQEERKMIELELRGKIFTVDRDRLMNVSGTYFSGMLSSGAWQPNSDGVYVIDRPSEGFDRILECLSTGKLDCHGLTDYEIDCVYANLDYFLIPFTRLWDYSKVSKIEKLSLWVHLQLLDGRLCGYASDHSICIYNIDTNIVEKSMQGHSDTIRGIIQLEDGRICSYSIDKTIRLWNIESGQCELTIHGHTDFVNCVTQLMDGRLCSGSWDRTIKIWNIDTGACELTIDTGICTVSIAQLRDGRICNVETNRIINIWNIATGVCEMTLDEHTEILCAIIVIDELRICSCSDDKKIKVWNISTGACERTLKGHTNTVTDMVLLLDGRICSVSYDGSAKIWNMDTGVCDLTVKVSARLHKIVQLHDGRLVLASDVSLAYIIGG
jgi:WD40 repeat protein